MKKELAKSLVEALALAEAPIQKIDSLMSTIDEDEKKKLVPILGQLIGSHSELLMYIKNQFPEFDPEGEGKDFYEEAKKP